MAWMASFFGSVLARWADAANIQRAQIAEADVRDLRAQLRQEQSQSALLKAEVEFLTQWRDKELARLKKEADIARAASVLSTELPERE